VRNRYYANKHKKLILQNFTANQQKIYLIMYFKAYKRIRIISCDKTSGHRAAGGPKIFAGWPLILMRKDLDLNIFGTTTDAPSILILVWNGTNSPVRCYVRTFHRLHLLQLWTPTIKYFVKSLKFFGNTTSMLPFACFTGIGKRGWQHMGFLPSGGPFDHYFFQLPIEEILFLITYIIGGCVHSLI
jgi:hypothetical protein